MCQTKEAMAISTGEHLRLLQVFSEENKIGLLYETLDLSKAEVVPFSYYESFRNSFSNSSQSSQRAAVSTFSYVAKMLGSDGNTRSRSSSAVQVRAQIVT